jgi:hypothetical protein
VLDATHKAPRTLALFPEDRYEAVVGDESVVRLKLSRLRLERPRQWGGCWLALQLWRQLELDEFWTERLAPSRKGTRWDEVLLILVVYRLLSPGSEWRLHREWFGHSALPDLLGTHSAIDSHTLYACHDLLLEHKAALFDHLVGRWRDLFNVSFDVLLYDLTSTYFEIDPPLNEDDKRRFGYSRDHRPDCVQVVIALIITPQGFPLAYEVLAGNTADNTTLKDFLARIERQYGKARRTWLMDRGIPTEEVLQQMRTNIAREAMGGRTARGARQTARTGSGAVRVRREPRSYRQGARHAPATTEVAVAAPQAALQDGQSLTRSAADEARRGAEPSPGRLAVGNRRDGGARCLVRLLAQSQEAARSASA